MKMFDNEAYTQAEDRMQREALENSILTLRLADQKDKHAPHFLQLEINKLIIWFSFETPIGYAARNGKNVVLRGLSHNLDMHAVKVTQIIRANTSKGNYESVRSKGQFQKRLLSEIKKETIHTSSEVMRKTFGVE